MFSAVVYPDVSRYLARRKFVAAKDVGNDFAEGRLGGADVSVGTADVVGRRRNRGRRGESRCR